MKKEYKKDDLTVIWRPDKCIHSTKCVHGLPEVFKPEEKPWIQLEHASNDAITKAVRNCPSGALSLQGDGGSSEDPELLCMNIVDNGPILIEGQVSLDYKGERFSSEGKRIALCRCGASAKKPFCDGAHKRIDFKG